MYRRKTVMGALPQGAGDVGPGPWLLGARVVAAQFRELLPQPAGGHALEVVYEARDGHGRQEVHRPVDVIRFPVELWQFRAEVRVHLPHDLLHALRRREVNGVPVLGYGNQVSVQDEDTMPAGADVPLDFRGFGERVFELRRVGVILAWR